MVLLCLCVSLFFTEKDMKYLLIFSLLFTSIANAQLSDKQLEEMRKNTAKNREYHCKA